MDVNFGGTLLITGANGGIGSELSRYFLTKGVRNIALCHRSEREALEPLMHEFDLSPDKHLFHAELTSEESVATLRENIEAKLGPVWGLLNVAGGSTNALSWKMSVEDFRSVVEQNLLTTFLCCREFIPGMRAGAGGRIVNFSSVVGFTGIAGASHYAAAKSAVVGFSKSLALELAPKSITANVISLGYFEYGLIHQLTPELQQSVKSRIPLQRFGTGEEIGGMVHFLLSKEGGYTSGQVLHINGGLY